eukprot:1726564-Pleurochrysis_carterae.AAC.1
MQQKRQHAMLVHETCDAKVMHPSTSTADVHVLKCMRKRLEAAQTRHMSKPSCESTRKHAVHKDLSAIIDEHVRVAMTTLRACACPAA